MHLGKRDKLESCIDERQDMSAEVLGVISAPADDTLSTLEIHPAVAEKAPKNWGVLSNGCGHKWSFTWTDLVNEV